MDTYSSGVNLNQDILQEINLVNNSTTFFGEWINHVDELSMKFQDASPFPHVVIPNFLNNEYAEQLFSLFPSDMSTFHKYCNPIEVKFAYDQINSLPTELRNYFYHLSSDVMIQTFQQLTKIPNLTYDEYLHGAGLHAHPRHGRLSVHLDYEKHPITGKERRANVILFLTKDWQPEWNGANELWDTDCHECVVKNEVSFNTAVVFRTNDFSWHGVPERILCPEGRYRQSLAYYYVSPLSSSKPESEYRYKAKFVPRPTETISESIQQLFDIRAHRRITQEDMNRYAPDWTMEL